MISYTNTIVENDIEEILSRDVEWGKLNNKTVLITGASGMLATYLVYTLMGLNIKQNLNIKVIGLVRNEKKARAKFLEFLNHKNFKLLIQDVTLPIDIKDEIDFIVHAAGNASPKSILSDSVGIIKANTIGTINVLELAKEKKVKNILYLSTREVYGKMLPGVNSIKEEDYGFLNCKELRACYPESKRVSETMFESYYHQYNVPYNIVRLAHAYGPGMDINDDGRVMADLISDVVNYRDIVLKSDGSAVRAFCYINDAVCGMFKVMLEGEIGEAYNIANETEPFMIRDVAKQLVSLFDDRKISVVYDIPKEQGVGYSKMGRVKLDTSKLEVLGWECKINLKEGLTRTVKSFDITQKDDRSV